MKNIRVSIILTILFFAMVGILSASENQIDLSEYERYTVNYEEKEFADYLHERLPYFSEILENVQKQRISPYLIKTDLFSKAGEISLIKSDEIIKMNQYINIVNSLSKIDDKLSLSIVPELLSVGFRFLSSGDSIEVTYAKEKPFQFSALSSITSIREKFMDQAISNIDKEYKYLLFAYTYLYAEDLVEGYAVAYSDTTQPMIIKLQIKSTVPKDILVKRGSFQTWNHTVLTYDYWIGRYEVTFNEYDTYCEATRKTRPKDEGWGRGMRPVINVSWWEAIAYCNWMSEKEGLSKAYDSNGNLLDKNGKVTTDITQVEGYRLPTEAEWIYAARGGHADITDGIEANAYEYAGSDTIDDVAWHSNNSGDQTHPVGGKARNELGLYDMNGNVWEWCHDRCEDYSFSLSTQTNPTGPDSGDSRRLQGGSWKNVAWIYSVVLPGSETPAGSSEYVGFRLARTAF
jgi:formylglycine-generating enzyme required for sulfatase activity